MTFRQKLSFYTCSLVISLQLSCTDLGVEGFPQRPCQESNIQPCEGPQGEWQFLGLGEERIYAIAIDPCNPQILYAGSLMDFSAGVVGKLFKSTDCGVTWQRLLSGGSYTDIVIDPRNSDIIYASPHAVIRSVDRGTTWKALANGMNLDAETRVKSIAIHPENSAIVYAGTTGFFGGRLYKSINYGESWASIFPDSLSNGISSMAIDDRNPNVIYIGENRSARILKTTDGGTTWSYTGFPRANGLVEDILVHPLVQNEVYAGVGFDGFWKSSDGGLSWIQDNTGIPDSSNVTNIAFSTLDETVFIAASRGDEGEIYQRKKGEISWTKIGINDLVQSYYYSDLLFDASGKMLYFGLRGVYRMKL